MQPATMSTVLEILDYIFTGIFAIEAFVKVTMFLFISHREFQILVLGGNYFSDGWNKFDFFIVIMSFFGLLVDLVIGNAIGST